MALDSGATASHGAAHPFGELAHPFNPIDTTLFKVPAREVMDALLFRAPRLCRIRTQLDVEGARRIIHKAGADTDEAPLERRLAGALHINAEPALLCEARLQTVVVLAGSAASTAA